MKKIPLPVARVILVDDMESILFLKRPKEAYAGGRWCLPGGKVDIGQTVQQAAVEETKQETNLDIYDVRFLFYQDRLPDTQDTIHAIQFYFAAKYEGILKRNRESTQSRWIPPGRMSEYDVAFKNDEAIKKYLSTLQ
jgi:8-oxo-dGTP diphosphatase